MNGRALVLIAGLTMAGCGGGGSASAPAIPAPGGNVTQPSPVPSPAPTSSVAPSATPPAAEAATFALEQSDLTAFTNGVNALCPGQYSAAATRFDVELLQANANALVSVLPSQSVAQAQAMAARAVGFAVAARALLPGIGFMINPNYPALVQNQANAPSWWNTAQNYPIFSAYYVALAQGLTQNGISYDVETNLIFPAYSGQNYSSVSIAQIEAGVAEDTNNTMSLMPNVQYLNFASEPLTLSQNTGQPSLDTVAGYDAYVTAIRAGVSVPAQAATKVGAGSADWSSLAFLQSIEAISSLGFNDLHLYPPDLLATSGGGIDQVKAINPSLTGRPGIITENWDEKDAGNAGSYGAANAPLLEQQNVYSFWAPLDAQYIPVMMKLARCQNLAVTSFWYENELFAYLDYASASVMTPSAAQAAIASAGSANVAAQILSTSGVAFYTGLTGHAPASRARL